MKLNKLVIMAIKGNTECRRRIKEVLDISEPTLHRYLTQDSDGLTKAAALKVIREELGLKDSEILEEITEGDLKVN